ncbi:MAG: Adenosylcobalamin-dependent ribonucleoside-triphosphate reductase [Syntrophomonadaceae bacterium]|nr:Adenosylcobalamin-dependent ribonucleoside-triphosphate reductase [Bacillota bacterium]
MLRPLDALITNKKEDHMKITSITPVGKAFTVDIEVADTHTYQLANGMVSHNTVSQRCDTASGLHARHAAFYYRRVRADNKDPLTKFMIEMGIPHEPDVTKPGSTTVFTFPKKAPNGALLRKDLSAIQHLKLWLIFQRYYCEHKPSVTISVTEKEWPVVGAFVWDHFDEMSGVSFLPYDGGSYRQAPYEDCTEKQYLDMLAKLPHDLNWDAIVEIEDNVEGAQMLACTAAGGCEI